MTRPERHRNATLKFVLTISLTTIESDFLAFPLFAFREAVKQARKAIKGGAFGRLFSVA